MAKENAFLAEQRRIREEQNKIWFGWGIQVAFDALTIALGEPEVMGKDTFGEARLNRINECGIQIQRKIVSAFYDKKHGSYIRADIDKRLAQICKNSFEPWLERYPGFDDRGI